MFSEEEKLHFYFLLQQFKTAPGRIFAECRCNLENHSPHKDFQWLLWLVFIQSVSKLLLKFHHVPGTVINSGDTKLNRVPALRELTAKET